jgi:uncharacterized protein YjbI with pentapeptide repeats
MINRYRRCTQAGTLANPEHLAKLKEGVVPWNQWRKENPEVEPDLDNVDLSGANLSGIDLSDAKLVSAKLVRAKLNKGSLVGATLTAANLWWGDLRGSNLSRTYLNGAMLGCADLSETKLTNAALHLAYLVDANLSCADLGSADFRGADLTGANLTGANLGRANLGGASLVRANLENTNLIGCCVYGISAWDVRLKGAIQSNLIITPEGESPIQVDNLEVAQFIYLLLNNEKIWDVIDTIGKKAVLILGRFTPKRRAVLDGIRGALRKRGYLPILFDFDKPSGRDTQETIATLAGLARFIIADITAPNSVPQELASIVPTLPSVPVQPVLQTGYEPWGMYDHIKRYGWVLPLVRYEGQYSLLADLEAKVIVPAEKKAKEQTRK